jgi:hypothetical protein
MSVGRVPGTNASRYSRREPRRPCARDAVPGADPPPHDEARSLGFPPGRRHPPASRRSRAPSSKPLVGERSRSRREVLREVDISELTGLDAAVVLGECGDIERSGSSSTWRAKRCSASGPPPDRRVKSDATASATSLWLRQHRGLLRLAAHEAQKTSTPIAANLTQRLRRPVSGTQACRSARPAPWSSEPNATWRWSRCTACHTTGSSPGDRSSCSDRSWSRAA